MVEGVTTFKYLGRPVYKTDDDWPGVRRNIMRARSVWGRLKTLLQQEGADPMVVKIFYREVVQSILLYSS